MASITLENLNDRFPDGTVISVYRQTVQQSGVPIGNVVTTGTVALGKATFNELIAGANYIGYANVSGRDQQVRFGVDAPTTTDPGSGGTTPTTSSRVVTLEGVPHVSAGHSFGQIQSSGENANTWRTYFDRLQDRHRGGTYTNNNVNSSMMQDVLMRALASVATADGSSAQTWVPGTRSAIFLDATINNLNGRHNVSGAGQAFRDALFGLLYLYRSGKKFEDSIVRTSGTWAQVTDAPYSGGSASSTTSQNASAAFQISGVTECAVILWAPVTGSAPTVGIAVDGTEVEAIDLTGRAVSTWISTSPRHPFVRRVVLPDTASHVVTVTKKDAGSGALVFDGLLTPSPNPPLVCVTRPVYETAAAAAGFPAPYVTDAEVDLWGDYIEQVVLSLGGPSSSLLVADARAGWDAVKMTHTDGVHPNDFGMAHLATRVDEALVKAALPNVPGTNRGISRVQPGTAVAAPGMPSQVAGLAANGESVTGTQISLSWNSQTANPAITNHQVTITPDPATGTGSTSVMTGSAANTYTATGMTTSTSYAFTVAAVNSQGTGPASVSRSATAVVFAPIVTDSFDRAATGSLGTTSDGTKTWSSLGYARNYGSDNAAASFSGTTTTQGTNHVDIGVADFTVGATLIGTATGLGNPVDRTQLGASVDNGLVGRLVDVNNFWMARVTPGSPYAIQKKVSSTITTPTGGTSSVSPAPGDVVRLVFSGTTITLRVNGAQVAQVTGDSALQTATKVGFWNNGLGASAGQGAAWDAFAAG